MSTDAVPIVAGPLRWHNPVSSQQTDDSDSVTTRKVLGRRNVVIETIQVTRFGGCVAATDRRRAAGRRLAIVVGLLSARAAGRHFRSRPGSRVRSADAPPRVQ